MIFLLKYQDLIARGYIVHIAFWGPLWHKYILIQAFFLGFYTNGRYFYKLPIFNFIILPMWLRLSLFSLATF